MMKNKENRKGKKMQMTTIKRIGETPSPLFYGNSFSRKLFNSGKKERKTKSVSLIREKKQSAGEAEPMEQDEALKENHFFVRKEDDETYFPFKTNKLTATKITEEVASTFHLPNDAINIEFKDGRKSIDVRKEDGTIQKHNVTQGDRLFLLKRNSDERKPFTLVEQGLED